MGSNPAGRATFQKTWPIKTKSSSPPWDPCGTLYPQARSSRRREFSEGQPFATRSTVRVSCRFNTTFACCINARRRRSRGARHRTIGVLRAAPTGRTRRANEGLRRLTVDTGTPSRAAALEKLPASTTHLERRCVLGRCALGVLVDWSFSVPRSRRSGLSSDVVTAASNELRHVLLAKIQVRPDDR